MAVLIAYFSVWAWRLWAGGAHPLRFDLAVTLVWLFSVALNLSPQLVARAEFSSAAVGLVIGSHALLMMGFSLGRGRRPTFEVAPLARVGGGVGILAAATAVMVGLTLLRAVLTRSVPVLSSFGSIEVARARYLENLTAGSGLLDLATQALKYPAMALAPLIAWLHRLGRHRLVLLAVAGVVAVADASFRIGGRADLVFVVVSMIAGMLFVYRLRLRALLIPAGIGVILFFVLGTTFALTRNPNFAGNQAFFIARICTVQEPGSWVDGTADPNTAALGASLCYFVSPMHSLDDFIHGRDDWDFRLGGYNAGLLTRAAFADARNDIGEFYDGRGLGTNPWTTSVRDFWLDFGYAAPLVYFPMGYAIARVSRRQRPNNPFAMARAALLVPWALMIPFISPLIISSLMYPLLIVVALQFATRVGWLPRPVVLPVENPSRFARQHPVSPRACTLRGQAVLVPTDQRWLSDPM